MVARWHQTLCVIQWTCWHGIRVQMSQWESVFVFVMGQWESRLSVMSQITVQWTARCSCHWNQSMSASQKPRPSYTCERDPVYNNRLCNSTMKARLQHLPSDPQSLYSSVCSLLILALRLENQTFRRKIEIRSITNVPFWGTKHLLD